MNLEKIDEIYTRYGYEVRKQYKDVRVYVLPYGMYFGADIVKIKKGLDVTFIKEDLYKNGYACRERYYENEIEVEESLFNGFFNIDSIKNRIQKKYTDFANKQSKHLANIGYYEYINAPYNIYNIDGEEDKFTEDQTTGQIINDILFSLNKKGAHLIIIEAAAGFGKTCTAYELLNVILKNYPNKSPFFTELSRNREARIFKHVLLSEIDSEYQSLIKSELVKYEIRTGRIPLIIDGFDELLSKDQSMGKGKRIDFEEVEAMLTTIGELLDGNAKVLLTSRKTAIFSGIDFINWLNTYSSKFDVIRFNIEQPRIQDWLSQEKISIIQESEMPIQHVSNPVLLSYLKNIDLKNFTDLVNEPDTMVDKYFQFLLDREKDRQNLLMDYETQLKIFKKLSIIMTELDITSENKDTIKDIIISYSGKYLESARKLYSSELKPSLDELADTLTNHALLDRIGSKTNNIGFINEFILGTLVGSGIIEHKFRGKFQEFPELIADSVITAFEYQKLENKLKLWEIFNSNDCHFDLNFELLIDVKLRNEILRRFEGNQFNNYTFNKVNFLEKGHFEKCVFNNCKFTKCNFDADSFYETSFVSCKFYDCNIVNTENIMKDRKLFFFSCVDDSEDVFHSLFLKQAEEDVSEVNSNYEKIILAKYFKVDRKTTRPRQISSLLNEFLTDYPTEYLAILKYIQRLKKMSYINVEGKMSFITTDGLNHFNKMYRESL